MFKKLAKWFFKITGIIPYLFYLKPRYRYENDNARKCKKAMKDGAILASNHVKILDYYCYLFKFFFKRIHSFVADVVYKKKGLRFMNDCMENIEIKRDGTSNMMALTKASECLNKKHTVLIFPEGKLEDKKGRLEKFSSSSALLSIENNCPIIPAYTDGEYGFFKRPIIVFGEPIYPDVVDCDIKRADELTAILRDKISKLKDKAKALRKYKTQRFFTFKYAVLDFVRITSLLVFYWIFPTKKYFTCKRNEIRKALKYNAILSGNHFGPCDPFFMYMHFFNRRIKIICAETMFKKGLISWTMNRCAVMKYRRDSFNRIDVIGLKEAIETLEGNGVVGIFPEGHINFDLSFDENIKGGSAMLSLMTNSPIIPFVFVNQYRYFRFNRVVIGKPIYPSEHFDLNKTVDAKMIDDYNLIIYEKMKELYNNSLKWRQKNDSRGNIK